MDILGSIGKALTDPGAIAQEAVGNFLPKEISGVLGNVVAGAVDLSTGNERQALQHALQGLADLPQLTHSAACSPSPGGSANFEPGLPPGGAGNMVASGNWRNTTNLQQLLQQILQALHGNNGNVTININTNPGQAPAATGAGNTAPSAPANGASSSTAPGGTTSSSGTTAPSDTSPASSGAVVANNDGKYDMKSLDAMNNTDHESDSGAHGSDHSDEPAHDIDASGHAPDGDVDHPEHPRLIETHKLSASLPAAGLVSPPAAF
jgi:hypothetical protein